MDADSIETTLIEPGQAENEHITSDQATVGTIAGSTQANPHPETVEGGASPEISSPPMILISGIRELGRRNSTTVTTWKPQFTVPRPLLNHMAEIIQRSARVRDPRKATPAPTAIAASYGSTTDLFRRLAGAIGAQTGQPDSICTLLAYWTLSTWFSDGLTIAPSLALFGPAFDGDLVLRSVSRYSRNPLLMGEINTGILTSIDWLTPPTLLLYSPHISRQVSALLSCATARGYVVGSGRDSRDIYGPKAVYLGSDACDDRGLRSSVQISLLPTATARAPLRVQRLLESEAQEMQNQLLAYRTQNLIRVYDSDFDAAGFSPDTRAVANALGASLVDAPELQSELISLLAPVEEQRNADRENSLEALVLQATLNLHDAGKTQVLVGEIAGEVNRVAAGAGESIEYSAETIGHRLKRVGLGTRRLGKAGRGLIFDSATLRRIEELAAAYCESAGSDAGQISDSDRSGPGIK